MRLPIAALAMVMATAAPAFAANGDEPERQARWQDVSEAIFGDRPIEPGDELIAIEAPARAMDAALVPITLKVGRPEDVKAVHLVIDENPSPYAAHVRFGPAGDPSELRLRVRINGYTNVHAVAETSDGRLLETSVFVKAAGGCSAPIGVSDAEALQGAGQMKMKFGEMDRATLMIRHPNFSGMQMNQLTRTYTPARYLDQIKVSYGDQTVFELAGDISLSTDPVIGFGYDGSGEGPLTVQATDSDGSKWEGSFPAPVSTN
ncbi:MAG TPA: quinoprotein dehydrogenase-associated SoxYZ-like carrier [Geminicoccus sp.]|jgi:sulfur-oxidizing protein SoxY|uniref:quinoprotein dehydrogenase-associated SoxYZ-like carrier n=1 Tax=Geminicoccus sp. TaxID=2024832 RepID=UPI002E2F8030|nr:quinoprotein dehydrogenase-associated SoxYZ-like carrier [Geminicoccus sp.]HEX2528787.1 quinoprotein dehydrogenase-associated SoxYZ-like carrier [Geminicoccus sp.]